MTARNGSSMCLACFLCLSTALADTDTELRILQRELLCVSVTLQLDGTISSGAVGIAFNGANFALRNIDPGGALQGATFRSCPDPSVCPGPSLSCPELADVDSGFVFEWELSTPLEAGVHEIARVCFVPVGDVEPGICSPLRFVDCLSDANGIVRTSLVDAAGATMEAQTFDGELCVTEPGVGFLRGDSNDDGAHDISDASFTLGVLFLGGDSFSCTDAADANDSGAVDVSDPSYFLSYLFLGGPPPPAPFTECQTDPTEDGLGCAQHICRPAPELELIAPPKATFGCGDTRTVEICWNDLGEATPEASDWIALYACGAANNQFATYTYNSGAVGSGCLDFTIPDGLEDGCYEFRYLPANGYVEVARSDAMLISGARAAPEVNLTIDADAVQGATCAGVGAMTRVCWDVTQGAACAATSDWIGLFATTAENTEYIRSAWFFTGGEATGCRDVTTAGIEAGEYEFRYLPRNGYDAVATSPPFAFSGEDGGTKPVVELTTTKATVAPGEEICVDFRLTANAACADSRDWMSIYACEATNRGFGTWFYTAGAPEGQFCWSAPTTPGCYEFRYLLKNGYTDTGDRLQVQVESP